MKVTAIQSHHGIFGMIVPGQSYETDDLHAKELINAGLVKAEGKEADPHAKKPGFVSEINVSEKADYKKGDIKEKAENKTQNVPTAKKHK